MDFDKNLQIQINKYIMDTDCNLYCECGWSTEVFSDSDFEENVLNTEDGECYIVCPECNEKLVF